MASLLGNNSALVNRGKFWNKFGGKSAGFLRVQITNLFRNINRSSNYFVMTFLSTLLISASSSTDLYRKFLTSNVSNKFAWSFLNILGGAGRFVHRPTLLLALSVAHLLCGSVALPHSLVEGLLLESDLTGLLKVLFANLFHGRFKLSNISVVALLGVLVGAL